MPRNTSYVMQTMTQGSLRIVVDANGRVRMEQATPTFRPLTAASDVDAVLASLNLPREYLGDVPITIVSTGLPDIFVHVTSSHVLHDVLRPDMAAISALSTQHDTIGMHVFTLSPDEDDVTAECRNFAPRFGIDEEAATGTSSGALGALLLHHGRATSPLTFSQGRRMGLPSRIGCIITTNDDASIAGVEISGIADRCGGQDVDASTQQ
ncbi:hypothetical protein SDRG_08857 [Saprolegnia diclina VS20]|uniref:Uncharacterized protein n=1 Tax=Saprolegnia diclina (strain VS20) TaxID=1156394 RepID=T0QJ27_SAPDV|nr:hypothetical protein SDRG_08857 [Saprolegnia diclina VS20]EQC33755.1 hypothetical protein SDRG_08857 [Saprolegnia diclina VS20]|eukprot:XP_008612978.1 hypothetical protein SDRG_08857 [Saprolegnia diclina VS20]